MSDNLFIGYSENFGANRGVMQWSVSKGEVIKDFAGIMANNKECGISGLA